MNVSTSRLADLLQISTRRIGQLVELDVLKKLGRGVFDLPASVQAFARWKVEQATASLELSPATRLQDRKAEAIVSKMDRDKQDLIPLELVLGDFDAISGEFLSSFDRLPALITDDRRERDRVRSICNEEMQRLKLAFAGMRKQLSTGQTAD